MALYSFTTNLLSAEKTGSPNLIGTSLSGVGVTFLSGSSVIVATQSVVVQSLSTNDVGIAFNPTTVNVGTTVNTASSFKLSSYPLSTVNVQGSVFTIPTQLGNNSFGIVKVNNGVTVFPWLSTTATVATSSLSTELNVSTANTRRLRILGYK